MVQLKMTMRMRMAWMPPMMCRKATSFVETIDGADPDEDMESDLFSGLGRLKKSR